MSCVYVIICQDYLLVVMCVYDRSSILLPSSALRESFLIRLRLSMETYGLVVTALSWQILVRVRLLYVQCLR